MQIGSFWGQPAPMILLESVSIDDYKNFLHLAQSSLGYQKLEDFKYELILLSQALRKMEYKTEVELNAINENRREKVNNGELESGNSIAMASIRQELKLNLVFRILEGERENKYVKVDGSIRDWIQEQVNSIVASHTGRVIDLRVKLKRKYEDLVSDEGESIAEDLLEMFPVRACVPDKVRIGDKEYTLNDNQKVVWKALAERNDFLDAAIKSFGSSTVNEIKIFDTAFHDLMKRKPISLYFIVKQEFDYVKVKPSKHYLNNVIEKVRKEITRFNECLNKYVMAQSEELACDQSLNLEFILQRINGEKCSSFFQKLMNENFLNASDLTAEELEMLIHLYYVVESGNVKSLNTKFGLELNEVEWSDLGRELAQFGVAGVNGYSLDLFAESISKMTFGDDSKIIKSDDELETLHKVLDNITNLLDTMIPIGEVI